MTFPIYGRVKPDQLTAKWGYKSRTADKEWRRDFPSMSLAPATCELYDRPNAGLKAHASKYNEAWKGWVKDVNDLHGSPRAFDIVWDAKSTGWLNRGPDDEPEALTWAWEYVMLTDEEGDSFKLAQLYTFQKPPTVARVNRSTAPDLIHRITTISEDGDMGLVNGGKTVFTTLASRYPLWIKKDRVSPFPMPGSPGATVKTTQPLTLRLGVRGPAVWNMPTGTPKKIRRYELRCDGFGGVSVWGVDVLGLAWVLKGASENYYTTWREF